MWAPGDVNGRTPLVHAAVRQSLVVAHCILAGGQSADAMDFDAVPTTVFTEPEVADVRAPRTDSAGDRATLHGAAATIERSLRSHLMADVEPLDPATGNSAAPSASPVTPEPTGLTEQEAASRLAAIGPNAVAAERPHVLRRLLTKLTGPIAYLLEAAVVLELLDHHLTEAIIIALLIVFNGALSFVQEHRADTALTLLRQRLAVQARVRRDGTWRTIDAADLVPGDVVHVRVGDIVPADLDVVDGRIALDAFVLTGESRPVNLDGSGTCYSGSVVVRGEPTAVVSATGERTYFGHTAQLVRTATTQSHLEQTILRIVRALLALDGLLVVAIVIDGLVRHLNPATLIPFVLILLVAAVPVALPTTFTLASSVGAMALARDGVLATHLSAIEEAAAMDLLCSNKTGTITQNVLTVTAITPFGDATSDDVLRLASAASDEATQDPIDLAILARTPGATSPGDRVHFTPFDPATKRSEALVRDASGTEIRVAKGAPATIASLCENPPADLDEAVHALASSGARVLAVARGTTTLELIGLVALGDPARPDSGTLITHLRELGVRVIMLTGDTPQTALAVAREVGIGERLGDLDDLRRRTDGPIEADVVASVLPEDKLLIVERAQRRGHVVGMTGDGVNDAPALKRAEVGIAVSNATDVTKSAASLVLTSPGLGGIVAAVETGRRVYQRMLTYTLNKIAKTFQVSLFLGLGLLVANTFVTTPRLVLLLLFANDVVTMSLATDRVSYSPSPDRWRVNQLALAALVIAVPWLLVAFATVAVGRDVLGLSLASTQTLAFVMLVATGQATVYLVREPGHLWTSAPSRWLALTSLADLVIVTILATAGLLMAPVPFIDVVGLIGAVGTLGLDTIKAPLLRQVRSAPSRPSTSSAHATGSIPEGSIGRRQ